MDLGTSEYLLALKERYKAETAALECFVMILERAEEFSFWGRKYMLESLMLLIPSEEEPEEIHH